MASPEGLLRASASLISLQAIRKRKKISNDFYSPLKLFGFMINITKGNDFKLIATFDRGGEVFKFDSVSSVSFLGTLDRKFPQQFDYADGKLTIKGTHSLLSGVYGIEVIGKEGDAVRRTAFDRVLAITGTTTAGSYDPQSDIDEYDIGIHLELDLSVDKTPSETPSDDEKKDDAAGTKTDTGSEDKADTGSEEGTSQSEDEAKG